MGRNPNATRGNETALMIEGLYNGISYDLKVLKKQIKDELKYSSVQTSSFYKELEEHTNKAYGSLREDATTTIEKLKQDLCALQKATEDALTKKLELSSTEIKYSYQQNQMIYEELVDILNGQLDKKLTSVEEKVAALDKLDEALKVLEEKLAEIDNKSNTDYDAIAETLKEKIVSALPKKAESEADAIAEAVKNSVIGSIPAPEDVDYDRIAESVAEKTEASVSVHSKEVLDAVSAIPVPENVDYTRIVEEVSENVLEKIGILLATEFSLDRILSAIPQNDKFDYDRVVDRTTEKVVESLPYPEKIDYSRLGGGIDENALVEKIATAVLQKMPAPVQPEPIDYDLLAEKVAQKLQLPTAEAPAYDVVVDEAGVQAIAERVVVPAPEKVEVDYALLAQELADRIPEANYEVLIDENGAEMIANAVAEKLGSTVLVKETQETVEEVVEEVVEETSVVEEPKTEELAVAESNLEEIDYDDSNQLVDAENGLVIRLKRSFTAKLRQSSPDVKGYYSKIKNALVSFKRLNSNVSWHGDRFNYGRDTVAKLGINGKTLCFYIALDPENEEYKQTVYHQKNVGEQKAYASTPFMIKVKSETGAKRAVRLINILAEKLQAQKNEKYMEEDYQEQFSYASTKELIDEGLIKVTKEKKVSLNF